MADPITDDDWRRAARAAVILIALEDARGFDLMPTNPLNVDTARARFLIRGALDRGLHVVNPNELWAARDLFGVSDR